MNRGGRARWVLAFDGSCTTCRRISAVFAELCDGIEVRPLADPDVRRWRRESLGSNAHWAPTLLRVGARDVRGWTGAALGLALLRRLGMRRTLRVLTEIGRQRRRTTVPSAGRGGTLLPLGAGLVVGALMMMRPPDGGGEDADDAAAWVEANRDRLPSTYDEFAAQPWARRHAIYGELAPSIRSQLWVDHLTRSRDAHAQLSEAQGAAIDRAVELVSDGATVSGQRADLAATIDEHRVAAVAAFGEQEAARIFAMLGPALEPGDVSARKGDCVCHHRDDSFCPIGQVCQQTSACRFRSDGCGWWWAQPCDGLCFS